jgi:hypothetical protein
VSVASSCSTSTTMAVRSALDYLMETWKKQKRVKLTCKCGASYILNTIQDLRSRCSNTQCHATLNMGAEELWKYQESIIALLEALGLERDYGKELGFARRMSEKFRSPFTIDIIEIRHD